MSLAENYFTRAGMSIETCTQPTLTRTDLDFRPEFLRTHFESLQSNGYSPQEAREIITGIAERDLTYTFLERFTKEKMVYYSYSFERGRLVSPKYEALGDVCDRYKEAIANRRKEGKPSFREEAELEGILRVKKRLLVTNSPTTFVIISPPPPPEELYLYPGYADYSFYYFGRFDPEFGQVDMFAWRNSEGPMGHPNDFLRSPIFVDGDSFEPFRKVITDMPAEAEFQKAKIADYAKYRVGIANLAQMLTALLVNGASDNVLRDAQVKIEMEFIKWVEEGKVEELAVPVSYLISKHHDDFSKSIRQEFAHFAVQYQAKISQFACGSCGGSAMSLFGSSGSSIFEPSLIMQLSMVDLFGGTKSCPNCREKISVDAQKCGNCQMTKVEYDAKRGSKS